MADDRHVGRKVEIGLERFMLASRWLQVPLYVGLVIVLAVIVVKFPFKVWDLLRQAAATGESDLIVQVLSLVDVILVANLVVMVIIAGYENFVRRLDSATEAERLSCYGRLDSGSLKIKIATSVVVISAIHLLQRFLEGDFESGKLYDLVILHLAFVATAVLLALTEWLSAKKPEGH